MKKREEFGCLGNVFTSDGEFTQDIERMRARASRLFGTLK